MKILYALRPYILYVLLLLLASCTEIIDIPTKDAQSQLVVEANIALNETAVVTISKTAALNKPNDFEKVSNATIRITDNEGKTELLTEFSEGIYESKTLKGEVGKTYSLSIVSGNQTIRSECKIPILVPIDSFAVLNSMYPGGPQPIGGKKAPFFEIKLKYSDPIEQQNFYRAVVYYNEMPQNRNNIFNDDFNNGLEVEQTLIVFNDTAKVGDKIRVEIQNIDKIVYNYFASMGMANPGGPGNSSSPANPYTNLNGAILGYFSAHTVERKEWVLK